MVTLLLILELATLLAITVIAVLAKAYLPSYVKRKGENLATKEDIAEITRQIEQEKATFSAALEELRADRTRQETDLSLRQQLYAELAATSAAVFLSGRDADGEDRKHFLAKHAAAFVMAPDAVVESLARHLDVQIETARLPVEQRAQLQPRLRETFEAFLLEVRRDAFVRDTQLRSGSFRFVSF